jgi:hypothetical protein
VAQFLSKNRAAVALRELFGIPVSEGAVAAMTERAADGLRGFLDNHQAFPARFPNRQEFSDYLS